MEMSDFATRLQQEIDAAGIDRKHLSEATGIPYQRMHSWFRRAKSQPRGADLLVVARHLNLDQDYLLMGGDRRPFNPGAVVLLYHEQLDRRSQKELEDFALFLVQRQKERASEQQQSQGQQGSPGQAYG